MSQGGIHSMLVDRRCIFQSLWHYYPLVQAKWCGDCSQVNIIRMNMSLKERICHIQLAPDFAFHAVG